uniref:Uncharacterized protein n=1 Tax=Rhipicephalus zambeziensis TaxID=60191 RepID=A0A224YI08_9ACAR
MPDGSYGCRESDPFFLPGSVTKFFSSCGRYDDPLIGALWKSVSSARSPLPSPWRSPARWSVAGLPIVVFIASPSCDPLRTTICARMLSFLHSWETGSASRIERASVRSHHVRC